MMDMASVLWPTLGLIGLLLVLGVCWSILRARLSDDPIRTSRIQTQSRDIETYIRQLKQKENEAWNEVMTVMRDEDHDLQTVFRNNVAKHNQGALQVQESVDAPITELQKAFFIFWKVPKNKIPPMREEATRFIKAYKARLKVDGYGHRVRRWERLEVMMERFYSDYSVEKLNERCEEVGLSKTILEILLGQTMGLLSKGVLSWRVVAEESSYQRVLKGMDNTYPQLNLDTFKRG